MGRLEAIETFADDLTELRRDFHAHPELGLEEHRTSGIVARYLEDLGIETHRGIGGTGVVGVLNGSRDGRTIGLRADMDALPIDEKTNLAWASKTPGLMHACGHDAHTTMLLGAARSLAVDRDFAGRVVFVFQPAEEGLGGARAMIADGLFERFPCDEIYAIHNIPSGRLGEVGINPGTAYSGADFFDVTISGSGAHGAYPHEGTDSVAAAGALIQGFHSIVSRNLPAGDRGVLSVTKLEGGAAYNVLPDEVRLGGTARFCSDTAAETIRTRMDDVAAGIATAFSVTVDIDRREVFTVLENDPLCSAAAASIAGDVLGSDRVRQVGEPDMGSEDFADMLEIVPGTYMTLGHAGTVPLHNPGFILDDAMLPIGAALYCEIAIRRAGAAGAPREAAI